MSWIALGWAATQKVQRAADKLVLIGLAERHNTESQVAYPSLAWLCEFSSLDRKTVVTALTRLEASGFISDSGKRVGKTKQVKAYTLHINSAEKGTVKTEPLPLKDTVFSAEQSRKRDTEPLREPVVEEAKASPTAWARPKDVSVQIWKDLLDNRKRKNKPNTPTAWKRFCDDLSRISTTSGIPPPKLIEHAAAEGWAGIYEPDARNGHGRTNGMAGHQSGSPTTRAAARVFGTAPTRQPGAVSG